MIDFRQLAKAGVHFGHQTARWNPKMASYIWGQRNGVHLIDVSKTAYQLEKAAQFLTSLVAEGKQVLWVGTKKPAHEAINNVGALLKMPHVTHRWIGGTLTNYSQVKKSITRLLHFEDIIQKSEQFPYTKKELNNFQKMIGRLGKSIGGIRSLKWPVGAVVLVDVRKEQTVLREARSVGVPVIALVDTNGDPSLVDYVIPCNDDSPKAINLVLDYLAQAAQRGLVLAAEKKIKLDAQIEETPKTSEEISKALAKLEADEEAGSSKATKAKVAARRPAARTSRGKKA
jgi:small subunit ribosomal protein S2